MERQWGRHTKDVNAVSISWDGQEQLVMGSQLVLNLTTFKEKCAALGSSEAIWNNQSLAPVLHNSPCMGPQQVGSKHPWKAHLTRSVQEHPVWSYW
eukprot:1160469-Pelagomonas_calceolata.AAC.7